MFKIFMEPQTVIRFLTLKGLRFSAIAAELKLVSETEAFAFSPAKKWRKRFAKGRTSRYDDPRCGKPLTILQRLARLRNIPHHLWYLPLGPAVDSVIFDCHVKSFRINFAERKIEILLITDGKDEFSVRRLSLPPEHISDNWVQDDPQRANERGLTGGDGSLYA
jgi:hypothetical protein